METQGPLLLLCHQAGWDYLYQAASAAAAATSMGRPVTVVFFFGALASLLDAGDEIRFARRNDELEQRVRRSLDEGRATAPSDLWAAAQRSGRLSVLACSASLNLVSEDSQAAARQLESAVPPVREIVGWPTITRLMENAGNVVYL